ncbi:uncharacterized protein ISCGN_014007 [Ixodes scapularis]
MRSDERLSSHERNMELVLASACILYGAMFLEWVSGIHASGFSSPRSVPFSCSYRGTQYVIMTFALAVLSLAGRFRQSVRRAKLSGTSDARRIADPTSEATKRFGSEPPKRRFKSKRGFLDVDRLDDHIFRSLFRFHKEDIGELLSFLRIPDKVTSAQGVVVAGEEALCITLRRLAYPNRWVDLEMLFGRSSSTLSSLATKVLRHIDTTFSHLLQDLNVHSWLDLAELERMSQAVHAKGAPLTNCWGFLDGAARAIYRPSQSQTEYFSGHTTL